MNMMGELDFFLGLQIKQTSEGTFINQARYANELLKMFGMIESKPLVIPMSTSIKLPSLYIYDMWATNSIIFST